MHCAVHIDQGRRGAGMRVEVSRMPVCGDYLNVRGDWYRVTRAVPQPAGDVDGVVLVEASAPPL
jgi:hypothetical protein